MTVIENNKELVPFEHYVNLFRVLDASEASTRCNVRFDQEAGCFSIRMLYDDYQITWPEFSITSSNPNAYALKSLPAQMLLMRYLLEGHAMRASGEYLTYREMPWGEVYLRQFTGRCITRAAFSFATRMDAFCEMMDKLGAIQIDKGDCGYQFEFLDGLMLRILLWEGDDEFPPNAQILFSDNFQKAFGAEDLCVVCDSFIGDFKRRMQN